MAHSLKIIGVEIKYSIVEKGEFLDVTTELYSEEIVDGKLEQVLKGIRKFGYPLTTTKDTILEDLKNVSKTLDSDATLAEQTVASDAAMKNAEVVRNELLNQ